MSTSLRDAHNNWTDAATRPEHDGASLRDGQFGERWESLGARQREVIRGRCAGLTVTEIAERLFLAEQTVKNHLTAAFVRLEIPGSPRAKVPRIAYLLGRYDEAARWRQAIARKRQAA